ncbi:G-type lectin S-receptor-like serine/threonine-protein kinase SD1-13 [Ziziphus jujuba]|uniref:G-type lectin S-receptor-like serine/threonine-protein kinase SD1-13 n=1 Tax=Ziziphus jujuba TaxID=326968 RepID=A0ABM3I8Q2_ZIZJJ|nr:G-type lectin S-receptor-like serine/threonine-protein kinase SD1-13 [Ziziphus jujuba]
MTASDFGMAKALFEREFQTKPHRFVGTNGYMFTEYAMHGLCSTKSDVFCFEVILLEIAWDSWNSGRCMNIMDPTMDASCLVDDIMLYIQVGLCCLQGRAKDRPSLSDAVSMFSNERMSLPTPKQPAYFALLSAAWFNLKKANYISKSCNSFSGRSTMTTLSFYNQSNSWIPPKNMSTKTIQVP